MSIENIIIREIFDSRGELTLEIELNGFLAQIPSGKSRGKNEVEVFDYNKARSILDKTLNKKIINKGFNSIKELDNFLINLDDTPNKKKIGGNLMLGISIAFSRALASEKKKELWEILREEFFPNESEQKKSFIFSNLINGGAHANNNLAIQEYLVVVDPRKSLIDSIKKLIDFYKNLKEFLEQRYKIKNLAIGDEGGYNLDFSNNFEPLKILEGLIYKSGLENEFSLALDAAASGFYQNKRYNFEQKQISNEVLKNIYLNYFENCKLLFSIEDPFNEDDTEGFKKLKAEAKEKWIVGDDLTTTNSSLIKNALEKNLINGVIIKPNQIGTISETCQAINIIKEKQGKFIISHRSGEVEDNFIIQLTKASNADAIKIGAPIRERILKFNELIRLF